MRNETELSTALNVLEASYCMLYHMFQEREKKREEKKKQMEQLKEWSRPREDMECDDLKVMVGITAVQSFCMGTFDSCEKCESVQ